MKQVFKLLSKLKWFVGLVVVFTLANAVMDLLIPTLMATIIDNGIKNANISIILEFGVYMFLAAVGSIVFAILSVYFDSVIASRFAFGLRREVFEKAINFSQQNLNDIGSSSLITRNTNDAMQIMQFTMMALRMILRAPSIAIGGLSLATTINQNLTYILLVAVAALAVIIVIFFIILLPITKTLQIKLDRLNAVVREKLSGVRVIRAFNNDDFEKKRFGKANLDLNNITLKSMYINMFINPIINIITAFTTVALLYFGALQVNAGNLEVGQLVAVIQYVTMILFAIIMMVVIFIMGPRAITSLLRIVEVINAENHVKDGPDTSKITLISKIEFKNVTFSYPKSNQPVLKDLNFNIEKGKVTAIIGSTGSGKSSIIRLLMRFYDYNSGSIMIDGKDLKSLKQSNIRDIIGFVSQKPQLFSGTILSNLALSGIKDETKINQVLAVASAGDFANEKGGLEAKVEQGGVNYSGGQKQRLAIARALAKDPEILIFDDSFSALDYQTEAKIFNNLKTELKSKTIIIVAQRISSIKNADQIIVLDSGKIVGAGKHDDLLKNNRVYKEIVESQTTKEEL
jgi:ATP-binding cassette, subfamily B, multidrug efflux pump